MAMLLDLLRGFALFQGIAESELNDIAGLAREESYSAGEVVFSEGDRATALYLLVDGMVSLEKNVQLGPHSPPRPATVEVLQGGEGMGWSALVPPHVYTASASCLEPTRVVAIDGWRFLDFMEEHDRVGRLVMGRVAELVATRLKDTTHMLTYFLSIVSHELKAPLAAVENYLNVILAGYTGDLTPQQRNMLMRSSVRLQELYELINDLVDLARMRPEKVESEFTTVLVPEVIELSLEDVQLAASDKGVRVEVDLPPALPAIIGAPNRLRQVFTNLLSNAVKFTPPDGEVLLRAREAEGELHVEVIDSGEGIEPEDLPYIFDDFYRRKSAQGEGFGLGLSIVRRIVGIHRGEVHAESPYPPDSDRGSRFFVRLPLDPRASATGPVSGGEGRLLVVP